MPLRSLVTFAVLLTATPTVNTYPQANHPRTGQPTSPLPPLSILPSLSLPTTNLTAPPPPIGAIQCIRTPTRATTNVSSCRPTLNHFRTFPNYRRIQSFQEGRYPKMPSPPPYAVHQVQSTCAVQIASNDPSIVDDFSFEQARALAHDILETCEEFGGRGGVAPIGHGVGWRVVVIGWRLPPGLTPGGMGEVGVLGVGSGEVVSGGIGEA